MTGLARISGLAVAAAIGFISSVGAQTGPTAGSRPTVTSPYWDQPNRNGINTPDGVTTFDEPTKLVSQTIQAVPQAHADYVVAQWTFTKLNNDLNTSTNHLRDDFHASDEYTNATNEFTSAYNDYAAARQDAVRGIQSTDDYRAAMDLRQRLTTQISNVAGSDPKKADTDRLAALAALKLEYITPVRTVERELIAASPRVASARDRLMKAGKEVARLEKTFARDVRDSIELADIRKNRASARIAYLASFTYLQEARFARNLSLVYATKNFGDGYGYGGGLADGGYGYGAGGYGCGYGYGYGGYGSALGTGYINSGLGGNIGVGAPNRGQGSNGFSPGFANGGNGYSPGFVNGGNGFSPGTSN